MEQQLSLSARPRSLDMLVGQEKAVAGIRGHIKSTRIPKAWLFAGPKGTGKTSTARIMALSFQCDHQEKFGNPCKECRAKYSSFPIYPISCSDATGKEAISEHLKGCEYGVLGDGKYRVYILDEIQKASNSAQNMLLDKLEDTPLTTIFILCTTEPYRLIDTIRSRCICYEMRELRHEHVTLLTERLLKRIKSTLPADRLIDALVEHGVKSPRLIAQAVEKYVATEDPEEAASVDGASAIDIKSLTKAVTRGEWPDVAGLLLGAEGLDIRAIRSSMISYLKVILLESQDINKRNEAVSKAILELSGIENAGDAVVSATVAAVLYKLTAMFSLYKL